MFEGRQRGGSRVVGWGLVLGVGVGVLLVELPASVHIATVASLSKGRRVCESS